jgi:hypothetical protein
MSDRAKKLRQKRRERRQRAGKGNKQHTLPKTQNGTHESAERPTEQRAAIGHWVQGDGKHQDLAADMIGLLLVSRQITPEQEQAARHWEQLRAAYIAEMPDLRVIKSCLNNDVRGHDDSDGDPEALAAYREMMDKLTPAQESEVLHVVDRRTKPRDLGTLRAALDVIGGT